MAEAKIIPCAVIVVEDEFLVRMLAVEVLTDAGFTVLAAEHAAAAITQLETHADAVGVLFTDIHMPGDMDGLGLAHHVRQNWPWITQLITSGRASPASGGFPDGSRFLPKPYNVDEVIEHVRELAACEKPVA